jgi:hypothetical protein
VVFRKALMTVRPPQTPTAAARPFLVAAVAVLLVCAGGAAPPEDEPVYNPLVIQPWQMSRLAVGVAADPWGGPLNAASALYAGTHPDHKVWALEGVLKTPQQRAVASAATLVSLASPDALGPFTVLGGLQAGAEAGYWEIIDVDTLPPIPADLLRRVRDEKPLPDLDSGDLEIDAYYQALIHSARYSEKAFRSRARKVDFARMFNEPGRLRGDVLVISGEMRRLRERDAPLQVAQKGGCNHVYEGWVFNTELYGPNPVCFVFTRLPPGLEPADDMHEPVTCYGIYFKKYRFKAGDNFKPNEYRLAPLLVGHVVSTKPKEVEEPDRWAHGLLPAFLGLVLAVGGLIVALTLWMRRGDAHVRRRLDALRPTEFVMPGPDAPAAIQPAPAPPPGDATPGPE